MEECSSDFVDKLYTEYSSGVAKITIDNRVSVTKSEWSVLASVILAIALLRKRVQKGRFDKEKENEFVIFMLRRVNKMQPSQSNWNFPDFFPVSLSKPKLLKLTIKMKIEMYHLARRQRC